MIDRVAARTAAEDDDETTTLILTTADGDIAGLMVRGVGAVGRLTALAPDDAWARLGRLSPRDQATTGAAIVLVRGALRIELDRRRVYVGERAIHLQPKEFALLIALALEPGRVFTRQELLDAVWDDDDARSERTVDVHVCWVRGKLANVGFRGSIVTVHGVGYRFVTLAREPRRTGRRANEGRE